jgi:hypothetical protein
MVKDEQGKAVSLPLLQQALGDLFNIARQEHEIGKKCNCLLTDDMSFTY